MKKRYSIVRHANKNSLMKRKTPKSSFHMIGTVPNIFRNPIASKDALSSNRIHCVGIERTAIYRDANGNQIILKENQHTMNAPTGTGEISYTHRGKTWKRKH